MMHPAPSKREIFQFVVDIVTRHPGIITGKVVHATAARWPTPDVPNYWRFAARRNELARRALTLFCRNLSNKKNRKHWVYRGPAVIYDWPIKWKNGWSSPLPNIQYIHAFDTVEINVWRDGWHVEVFGDVHPEEQW